MSIFLRLIPGPYSVFKIKDKSELNRDVSKGYLYSVTKTPNEISVICEGKYAPADSTLNWRFFEYKGSLDDGVIGVVASITQPLAAAGISVFVNTTYDSGYFGVKAEDLRKASDVLIESDIIVANFRVN